MNGESVFGWVKVIAAVAILAGLFYVGRLIADWIKGGAHNPIANAADSVVKTVSGGAAQGGEDSIGGYLARVREWLFGTDKKIEAMKKGAPPLQRKPIGINPESIYVGDLPIGEIELPNPRDAR